jgi:hypothetical protein
MDEGRHYERSLYFVFSDATHALNMTPTALCRALGYADGTHNKWKANGEIPRVAEVAIEGLLAAAENSKRVPVRSVTVMHWQDGSLVSNATMKNPDRITLNGNDFLLIPITTEKGTLL